MPLLSPFDSSRTLSAVLTALIAFSLPTSTANACQACDPGGGAYNYCASTTAGYSRCYSGSLSCTLSGPRCAIARQEADRSPRHSPLVEEAPHDPATDVHLDMRPERSRLQTAFRDSAGIEGIRTRVAEDAVDGRIPDPAVRDAVLLIESEQRDEQWAAQAESYILKRLSALNLGYLGLSRPAVRCATTVCEIAIVQGYDTAKNSMTGWQRQFFRLDEAGGWGPSFAESAMLMRMESGGRVAFLTYLHYERERS